MATTGDEDGNFAMARKTSFIAHMKQGDGTGDNNHESRKLAENGETNKVRNDVKESSKITPFQIEADAQKATTPTTTATVPKKIHTGMASKVKIGISNCCLGISSLSFSHIFFPIEYALSK